MEMDHLDKLAASVLDGYLVRKDLVRTFSRQFPVPTYVVEFLLGRKSRWAMMPPSHRRKAAARSGSKPFVRYSFQSTMCLMF